MRVQTDPCSRIEDLSALASEIRVSLEMLGERVGSDARLFVSSPIAIYVGGMPKARTPISQVVKRSAWRRIVSADAEPVALIDQPIAADDRRGTLSVRPREAALALLRALERVDSLPTPTSSHYRLRFVSFPHLYVTAVWISAAHSLFIPTRRGHPDRPAPEVLSESSFRSLLLRKANSRRASKARGRERQ